jgi:hypothetical protein
MRNNALSRGLVLAAGLCVLSAIAGCGGAEAGQVSGKVTLNGRPLEAGKVTFYDPDRPGRNVIGDIKQDGTYRVFACPTGNVKVTVQPLPPPARAKTAAAPAKEVYAPGSRGRVAPPAGKQPSSLIPAVNPKYSDPATTDLVCRVHSGPQTFDIDLKP